MHKATYDMPIEGSIERYETHDNKRSNQFRSRLSNQDYGKSIDKNTISMMMKMPVPD